MKILDCVISNFGSYKDLVFDFTNTGLALCYGPTGSGKSTLQDIIPWILFGITSKGGNVDDIRNWKSDDSPTAGAMNIELSSGDKITVYRTRGTSKQNDLYWEAHGLQHRGKDLTDTQKLLNQLLGCDAEVYTMGASLNEFSEVGEFFTLKAKDKREVFEKISNLQLPTQVADKMADIRKTTKKELVVAENLINRQIDKVEHLKQSQTSVTKHFEAWEKTKQDSLKTLKQKSTNFDKEKAANLAELETKSYRFDQDKLKKIDELVDRLEEAHSLTKSQKDLEDTLFRAQKELPPHCPTCGKVNNTSVKLEKAKEAIQQNTINLKKTVELTTKLREVQQAVNPFTESLKSTSKIRNQYLEQLNEKVKEVNPFLSQVVDLSDSIPKEEYKLTELHENFNTLKKKYNSADILYDLSFELRGVLLKQSVVAIQDKINNYMDLYFDSEFRVNFGIDADSLVVDLYKSGYPCLYRQLSKGQRQLLRLLFSIAVMGAVLNNSQVSLNVLTFDEALDGLDSDLKVRAYELFSALSKDYASVLVIDHNPEFQNIFSTKYRVSLEGDESQLIHES